MWHISVRRLLKGEVLPTVEMFLKLCFPLGISPTELFEKQEVIGSENLQPDAIEKPIDIEAMKTCLEVFLNEHPPPSANEVSRRTRWSTSRIQRNFPAEYKQIVSGYAEYTKQKIPDLSDSAVERILVDALRENPPPSLQNVFRRTGCRNTGYRYYQRFPELCSKIATRYKKFRLKNFNLKKAKRIVELALGENPPPSFSEVARRLECTREKLRKKLPELSESLNRRYGNYLKTSRQENIQNLHSEVRKVLINLQKENTTISINKVEKLLPRKWNDENFKAAYRLITKEMNLKTEK